MHFPCRCSTRELRPARAPSSTRKTRGDACSAIDDPAEAAGSIRRPMGNPVPVRARNAVPLAYRGCLNGCCVVVKREGVGWWADEPRRAAATKPERRWELRRARRARSRAGSAGTNGQDRRRPRPVTYCTPSSGEEIRGRIRYAAPLLARWSAPGQPLSRIGSSVTSNDKPGPPASRRDCAPLDGTPAGRCNYRRAAHKPFPTRRAHGQGPARAETSHTTAAL